MDVTILVPVKNEELYIKECLDSIVSTNNLKIEVIVVDDHSEDETFHIACDISRSRRDIPIIVLKNTSDGKAAALNVAFQHAKGRTFVLLAGDDLIVSELLPERVAAVDRKHPAVAQCRYQTFSDDRRYNGILLPRRGRENHLAGGATSFNRAFADLYFPIPEHLPNEDTWLRAIYLLLDVPLKVIESVGLQYRIHIDNSLAPTLEFGEINTRLASRHAAFGLALQAFPKEGTWSGRARLRALANAERLRSQGRWSKLLVARGLTLGDRMVFLANTSPCLYRLKQVIRVWLNGWRS